MYFSEDKAEVVINENGLFNWFEDEFVAHQATLDGSGITGGAATEAIGIVSAAWINVGDIFIDEANDELVYVTVVTSATAITIGSLDGGNLSASAGAGGLKKLGSRNNEFATARTAISTKEILVNNYLNIHSETVTTSGRYQSGEKYTNGKTHDDQVQKKVEEMKFEFEDDGQLAKMLQSSGKQVPTKKCNPKVQLNLFGAICGVIIGIPAGLIISSIIISLVRQIALFF